MTLYFDYDLALDERPSDAGHDEAAWARDRRDERVPVDMRMSQASD